MNVLTHFVSCLMREVGTGELKAERGNQEMQDEEE